MWSTEYDPDAGTWWTTLDGIRQDEYTDYYDAADVVEVNS
jgi:hypothetical protein